MAKDPSGRRDPPVRHSELVRRLSELKEFDAPQAREEQVTSPPEAAAVLLEAALARGDLLERTVVDLGSGTGFLAIGAAWLGAARTIAIERDKRAVEVARRNATEAGVEVDLRAMEVEAFDEPVDTVVMNPPFGAQRAHADRPFWETAFRCAEGAIYAFALAESRTFIARRAVERSVPVVETRRVPWELPARFAHHRKPRVGLEVDLWVLEAAARNG